MADKLNSAAAEIAQEANAHILARDASMYEITVHALGPDPEPIDLFCECGCMGRVAVIDSLGVVVSGRERYRTVARRQSADNGYRASRTRRCRP